MRGIQSLLERSNVAIELLEVKHHSTPTNEKKTNHTGVSAIRNSKKFDEYNTPCSQYMILCIRSSMQSSSMFDHCEQSIVSVNYIEL